MNTVRGKFKCTSKVPNKYGDGAQVNFWAQYSDTPEDNTYAKATPSGQISMMIDNQAAADFFVEGEQYYLDFSRATKPVENESSLQT